jgi:hypothetical protein
MCQACSSYFTGNNPYFEGYSYCLYFIKKLRYEEVKKRPMVILSPDSLTPGLLFSYPLPSFCATRYKHIYKCVVERMMVL